MMTRAFVKFSLKFFFAQTLVFFCDLQKAAKKLNDWIPTRCFRALPPNPHPETAPESPYTTTYYAIMQPHVFSKYIMPICLFSLLFEMTWRCFCKAIWVATVMSPVTRQGWFEPGDEGASLPRLFRPRARPPNSIV